LGFTFFTPTRFSSFEYFFEQSKLNRAFELEDFTTLAKELLSTHSLSSLMQENHQGLKAWQYEHVPEK
tara:strand:+ start:1002 stop:1205 length:204 start_codon:yes stop_codon:yes gene_type:complete